MDAKAFRAKAHAWWIRATPVGRAVRTAPFVWEITPATHDDPALRAHDDVVAARQAVRSLRLGDRPQRLLATIELAIPSPVLHPDDRERYQAIASVRRLLTADKPSSNAASVAQGKALGLAESHEAVKLIRVIEWIGEGHGAEAEGFEDIDTCVQDVVVTLAYAGWTRAARHADRHRALVREALAVVAKPTKGKRGANSPRTVNQVLHELLRAEGFASVSFARVKNIRSGW